MGVLVPTRRLPIKECRKTNLADKCSDGKIRLTVEQNFILPNINDNLVVELLTEDTLSGESQLKINLGFVEGDVISYTGE